VLFTEAYLETHTIQHPNVLPPTRNTLRLESSVTKVVIAGICETFHDLLIPEGGLLGKSGGVGGIHVTAVYLINPMIVGVSIEAATGPLLRKHQMFFHMFVHDKRS
jgi:hypothetical protein